MAKKEEIRMGRRNISDAPWITKDGVIDISKLPLEYNFDAATGSNRQSALESIRVLKLATHHGRLDASVFLMGLLVSLPLEDWEMRSATVDALQYTHSQQCAMLLFSEIRRVKSSNTTRRYIDAILDVLGSFPEKLVRTEFEALAADTCFSHKMRQKFRALAEPEHGHFW